MNTVPSISVIIPAFDEADYLPATMQAIRASAARLQQNGGTEIEIVVVDNNSTDATAEVAQALGARVVQEPEHNIARVRNRGAESARGDALVFVDADTQMPEELLSAIHPSLAAPGCIGGAVDTDYRPRKRYIRLYLGAWRLLGKAAGIAQGATQFCSRETFAALGGYDENLFMGEDADFYIRMKQHARKKGGSVRLIDEFRVVPSCRRFDQWPLWKVLVWTNPVVIALLRRVPTAWGGWYKRRLR